MEKPPMSDTNRTINDATIACAFMILYRIRGKFTTQEIEGVFEHIRDSVDGAIRAVLVSPELTQDPRPVYVDCPEGTHT
jgi:hypothetical protein